MGREVKRVPLDFDWPMEQPWHGYLIGYCQDDGCDDCRKYAKYKGLELTDYDCPIWDNDPPKGEGYQMWETVSEGSPISPVFETVEELARWLADTGASACGYTTASYEQWLGMIQAGHAPSMVSSANGLVSGVEYIGEKEELKK